MPRLEPVDPRVQLIGARLRAEREARDLTLEDLAELSGLHATSIGLIERGERDLQASTLLRICQAMGLDPAEVVRDLR